MKKSTKAAALAIGAVILAGSAFAAGNLISIDVDPSVKIMVNGSEFHPTDVNGNEVMTFIYNGTTYAPLRALAEAYGLEVGYDSYYNMATVSEPNNNIPANENYQPTTGNLLYSDEFVSISYSKTYHEPSWLGSDYDEYGVELLIENKTDVELTISASALSLNGKSYKLSGYNHIAPRSTGEATFSRYAESVPLFGVTSVSGKLTIRDSTETMHFVDSQYWYYEYDVNVSGNIG